MFKLKKNKKQTGRTGFTGVFTDLWYVVVPSFSFLLLQFDGDSSDWTPLDPFHQMCHIPVAKSIIIFMNRHLNIHVFKLPSLKYPLTFEMFSQLLCLRASGSERKRRSVRHGKSSQICSSCTINDLATRKP